MLFNDSGEPVSEFERGLLELAGERLTDEAIAGALGITVTSVRAQLDALLRRLGLLDQHDARRWLDAHPSA